MNETVTAQQAEQAPRFEIGGKPHEVRELGEGWPITQRQLLDEMLGLGADWRLETVHELYALRGPLTERNEHGALSADDTIQADVYWTAETAPWSRDCRFVVNFYDGSVLPTYSFEFYRARARAVRELVQ